MNKADLITVVAEHTGLSKSDAGQANEATFAAITSALKNGEDVRLIGFGTFSVTSRPARAGRDPRTGAAIKIAAGRQPKFAAGKALKDTVNA